MATRPVFIPAPHGNLVEEKAVDFEWHAGFAVGQKQRCIESLHRSAFDSHGLGRLLEVSTKSALPLGVRLSAFNLSLTLRDSPHPVLLEAAFQGSKVFATRGPFTHLYSMRSGREVKRYMKELANDRLTGFRFAGRDWGLAPKTAFYDWLYIAAMRQLTERDVNIGDALAAFDGFTDIEFNPKKSLNCQARSCALYVALLKDGSLNEVTNDPNRFVDWLKARGYGIESGRAHGTM